MTDVFPLNKYKNRRRFTERLRFFSKSVVENGRNRKFGSRGKPARAKLKENRLREARKRQTEG